jgi:hypothetical protein
VRFIEIITRTTFTDHTIAVIVEIVAADLFFAIILGFGTMAIGIALETLADAVRFIEIIAGAAFIDHTIAVIVDTVIADLRLFLVCGHTNHLPVLAFVLAIFAWA